MHADIDVFLNYQLGGGDSVLLTLEAANTPGQRILESTLDIDGATLSRIDGEGAIGQRVWADVNSDRLNLRYRATVEVTRPDVVLSTLHAVPLTALPAEVVSYIRPSRFCQSDLFLGFTQRTFGHLDGGAKISAIVDWVGQNLAYVPGSSHGATTAMDTFVSREGVCRDYAHLVCSLARAANIPARYTSGYGPEVKPQDFHAVAEVWLDGAWHVADATGMSKPSRLIMIGSGRDAADVAFMETENFAQFIDQSIRVSAIADPDT